MKILHIIKELHDNTPIEITKKHNKEIELHILLLHDAVLLPPDSLPASAKLFAGATDAAARNITTGLTELTHDEIVDLICTCDKIISW